MSDTPRSDAVATPAPVDAAETDPLVGTVLAHRYRVESRLGAGGMGTVYLVQHTTLKKHLAVKVLSSEFCHKPDLVTRFLREARAASMISQQNVVEITDFGETSSGSVFFVMERLEGENLSDTLEREGPMPWERARPIMLQICRALSAAHKQRIIHRDMKPDNCFRITRGGNPDFIKVLDFGIAKVMDDEGDGKGLTKTGMIFGTPEYMSPEQAQGERPDHRVDIYAAGIILYQLLTGQVPFKAATFMGILTKHMFEAPPTPSTVNPGANIPPKVEAIVLKALQKDRNNRFADMDAMTAAIETAGDDGAAVNLVPEDVRRPREGIMQFLTGSETLSHEDGDEILPPSQGEIRRPRARSPRSVALAAGVLGLVGMGGTYAAFSRMDAPSPPPPTTPEPESAPAPPSKPVANATKHLTPLTRTVTLHVETPGIDANVLDAADEGSYGRTNSDVGVKLERSSDPVDLILRAPGHKDRTITVTPDRDARLTETLEKSKVKTWSQKNRRPETSKSSLAPTAPPVAATPETPKPEKSFVPPELTDPFG